jgi:hypothetical protein
MKQALEALEELNKASIGVDAVCLPGEVDTAMDALRLAIEQAEKQESYWQEEARRYAGNADFWREKAKAAVAAEREACAKVCDELSERWPDEGGDARSCAYAIRARGQA